MSNENNSSAPLKTSEGAYPALPEPTTWLVERGAFRASPHGQDAESNEWLEEAHEPGEKGSFAVYTEQQLKDFADANHAMRLKCKSEQKRLATLWGFQAAPAAVAVPTGWKLVPIEPTPAMLDAAARASMQHLLECILDPSKLDKLACEEMTKLTHASRYRSMLAATPALPATEDSSAGDLAEVLPDGWVPCTITYEGQYPEDVAYGPKIMMDRLKKWLERYFALKTEVQAEPVAWTDDQVIRFAGWVLLQGNTCDSIEIRLNKFRGHEALRGIPAPQAQPADALLLDYLQTTGSTVEIIPGPTGWNFRVGGLHTTIRSNLRSSIDAAMAAAREGGKG